MGKMSFGSRGLNTLRRVYHDDWIIDKDGTDIVAIDGVKGKEEYRATDGDLATLDDYIVNDATSIMITPGTYTATNFTVDDIEGLYIGGTTPAPHSGYAGVNIVAKSGQSCFTFRDIDGVTLEKMIIKGKSGASVANSNPWGIKVTEGGVRNIDALVLRELQITDFAKGLNVDQAYGSSRGMSVYDTTIWAEQISGSVCISLKDASQWNFNNVFAGGQGGVPYHATGVAITLGSSSYSERLSFRGCQMNGLFDGYLFNTTGQYGMVGIEGGIVEACNQGIHNIANATSRRNITLQNVDFVGIHSGYIVNDGGGYIYVNSIGSYIPSTGNIVGNVVFRNIDAQALDSEWSIRKYDLSNIPVGGNTGNVNLNNSGTYYYTFNGSNVSGSTTQSAVEQLTLDDATFTRFKVLLGSAITTGQHVFTLMCGGAATNMIVTLLSGESGVNSGSVTNVEAQVMGGSGYCLRVVSSGSAMPVKARWGIIYNNTLY